MLWFLKFTTSENLTRKKLDSSKLREIITYMCEENEETAMPWFLKFTTSENLTRKEKTLIRTPPSFHMRHCYKFTTNLLHTTLVVLLSEKKKKKKKEKKNPSSSTENSFPR